MTGPAEPGQGALASPVDLWYMPRDVRTRKRSPAKDGIANLAELWFTTNFDPFWRLVQANVVLRRTVIGGASAWPWRGPSLGRIPSALGASVRPSRSSPTGPTTAATWRRPSTAPAPSRRRAPWFRPNRMSAELNLRCRPPGLIPSRLTVAGEQIADLDTRYNPGLVVEHRLGRPFEEASNPPGAPDRPIQHGPRPAGDRAAEHEKGCAVKLRCSKDYLAHCGFPRVTAFDEISSHARGRNGLRDAYRSVDDIEFNVGLFPQDKRPNSVLPRLMGCIVGIESQALTNPLLAARVVNEGRVLAVGMPHHPHDLPRLRHPELRRPAARSPVRRDHDEI